MKSHIKSKKFYQEAEEMQDGWGEYLHWIDKLKDKKARNGYFTIDDFCWTLYGDGYCSSVWDGFRSYCRMNKQTKLRYNTYVDLFREWTM